MHDDNDDDHYFRHRHHQDDDDDRSDEDDAGRSTSSGRRRSRHVTIDARTGGGRTARVNFSSGATANGRRRTALDGSPLSWYERLMPECVLNVTAPLTGYETQLDSRESSELDEHELELLERQRLKRNRKIRRRLLTIMLVASIATTFFVMRGRGMLRGAGGRAGGVKAALGEFTHRIEDGFGKKLHDTLGK